MLPRTVLALTSLLGAAIAGATEVTLIEPLDGQWITRDQPVVLRIKDRPPASAGRIAVFIGPNDMTSLCTRQRSGDLRCAPSLLTLPEGEQAIVVYLVSSATDWQEIGRLPLKVMTGAGLEVSEVRPRMDLNEVSQFDDGVSPAADTAPDSGTSNLAGQAGFATKWRRSGWELRSALNVVGTTVQQQALRFGTLGNEAPNVDLTDYLVELERGGGQLAMGHVSYGNQPLLLTGLSHRGFLYRQKIGNRVDLGFTAQSGQMLAGYSDFLGITDSDNYIGGASVGLEFLKERPGGLRLNVAYLNAETVSDLDFNTGQVPDAQKNTGYDMQLTGSTAGNRVRGSVEFAVSRYTNPDDPTLSQGATLVPVKDETSEARSLDLAFDLMQNRQVGANTIATVTVGFQHLRADPLYRTVGAMVTGDQEINTGTLNAMVGFFSFQAQHSAGEDNVDDLPTLLTTRTDTTMLSYGLPLRSLFTSAGSSTRAWLPENFTQSYAYIHQYGANRPPGFDPNTHIPDQVSQNITTGMNWSFWRATLGYQFTLGDLDNRQPERAQADFRDITHGVSIGLQFTPTLRVGLGLNATDADDREQGLQRNTDGYNFDLDWLIGRSFGFRGNYTLTDSDDTKDIASSYSWTTLTELNYRFQFPALRSRKLPGQFYIRYASQASEVTDNVFGLSSYPRTWALNGGFNISLF